jgi:ureidoglycolate dehydrogenase (NAD+)
MPQVDSTALSQFTQQLMQAKGMSASDAAVVATSLQWADDRGIASHGVAFLPRYLQMVDEGDLDVHARPERVHGTPAIVDAHQAAGALAMAFAMQEALREVQHMGTVNLWVRRLTHAGAMGQFVQIAAEQGCMAMLFAAGPPLMAYHGAAKAGATTGPLAMAVPGPDGAPIVFDMATSEISFARMRRAQAQGAVLPMNSVLDAHGTVTTDAAQAVTPLPMAGAKGSGLALMFELMASLAMGNPVVAPHLHASSASEKRHTQNAMIMLAKVDAFPAGSAFMRHVTELRDALKAMPKAQGIDQIYLPGERRRAHWLNSQRQGVAVDAPVWKALGALAQAHGLALPAIRP